MPRIRTIKPEFFKDEDLIETCNFQTRLFFAGLWLYADRAGRLEYRPKYLKAELFPYESADIEKMVRKLANPDVENKPEKKFLIVYQVGSKKFLEIVEFLKHQKPHHTERVSLIPEYNELEHLTVISPLKDGDNLFKKGRKGKEGKGREVAQTENAPKEEFEDKWKRLPSEMKIGKQEAKAVYLKKIKTREDEELFDECWKKYYASVLKAHSEGFKQKWKNGLTWFRNYKRYEELETTSTQERGGFSV
jgi:hypothetical protein